MTSASLWMGDVGVHWDEAYINSFFVPFPGFQRVKLMTRSGYGFVDFDSPETAAIALNAMNGRPTGQYGTTFRLNWAGKGKGADALGLSLRPSSDYSVFVAGLPLDFTEEQLFSLFMARYVSTVSVRIVQEPMTGESKGYGFVRFSSMEDQRRSVLEMTNAVVNGSRLRVSEAQSSLRAQAQHAHTQQVYAAPGPHGAPPLPPGGMGGMPGYSGSIGAGAYLGRGPPPVSGPPMDLYGGGAESTFGGGGGSGPPNPMSMTGIPPHVQPLFGPLPAPSEGQTTVFVGGLDPSVSEFELYQAFATVGPVANVKVPKDKGCGFVQFSYRVHAEQALLSLQGLQFGSQHIRLAWGKNQLGSRSPIAVAPPGYMHPTPHYMVPPRAPHFPPAMMPPSHYRGGPALRGSYDGYDTAAMGGGRGAPSFSYDGDAMYDVGPPPPSEGGMYLPRGAPTSYGAPMPSYNSGPPADHLGPLSMDDVWAARGGMPAPAALAEMQSVGASAPPYSSPTDTLFASMAGLHLSASPPLSVSSKETATAPNSSANSSVASGLTLEGSSSVHSMPGTGRTLGHGTDGTLSSDAALSSEASAYNASWGLMHLGVTAPTYAVPRPHTLHAPTYGTPMATFVPPVPTSTA